jgi:hypothetical protein
VFQITSAAPVMMVPSQIRDPRSQLGHDRAKKLVSLISRSSRGLPAAVDSPQRFGAVHTRSPAHSPIFGRTGPHRILAGDPADPAHERDRGDSKERTSVRRATAPRGASMSTAKLPTLACSSRT